MKTKLFFLAVFSIFTLAGFAQTEQACVGALETYKIESPTSESIYNWEISTTEGSIVSGQNTSKVELKLADTQGLSTLWVVETNKAGCQGEKTALQINRVAAPTASISGNIELCNVNTGAVVTFTLNGTAPFTVVYKVNNLEKSLNVATGNTATVSSNAITQTTVFELVSITDKNGCKNAASGTATLTVLPALPVLKIVHD
jgi:hypothetical protein